MTEESFDLVIIGGGPGGYSAALYAASAKMKVALVEADLGPPPTAYAFVVLGSVAREEEALSADQDHALVVAEAVRADAQRATGLSAGRGARSSAATGPSPRGPAGSESSHRLVHLSWSNRCR